MGFSIKVKSKVTVKCGSDKKVFQIVPSSQVNPFANMISLDSPLGKELVKNQDKGDFVLRTPMGEVEYKIVEVENGK